MRLNTQLLKSQYRTKCQKANAPVTKLGFKLFKSQTLALAAIQKKQDRKQRITAYDAQRAGMPLRQATK